MTWTAPLEGGGADNVRTDGDRVYVEREAVVTAFDAGDGTRLWRSSRGSDPRNHLMAVLDGSVYRTTLNTVEALDGTDGTVRWTFLAPGPLTGVSFGGGLVLVGDGSGALTALLPGDGTTAWQYGGPGGWLTPRTTRGGTVYAFRAGEAVFALDVTDGTVEWRSDVPATIPFVRESGVYTGTRDGRVVALDGATGETQWTFETEAAGRVLVATEAEGLVVSSPDAVYRVALDGTRQWRTATDESSIGPALPLGVHDGRAYVLFGDRLFAMGFADGRRRWTFDADTRLPVVVFHHGAPYVADGATLNALRPDGRERWTLAMGGSSDVTLSGGVLYAAGDDVVAVDANGLPEPSFEASRSRPTVGRPVTFDATGTTDPDGTVSRYRWAFGDGSGATGERVVNRYDSPGRYEVTLTVTDDRGATAATTAAVVVAGPTRTETGDRSRPVPWPGPVAVLGALGAVAGWRRLRTGSGSEGPEEAAAERGTRRGR